MLYGSMRHHPNGRKKKKNYWGKSKSYTKEFTNYVAPTNYRRGTTEHIPSVVGTSHDCGAIERPRYTGTLVKGISTMHKSNAVPIIDEREAKEHASMRR